MSTSAGEDKSVGRGSRRKKIAGYLRAANDLRQSYQQAYQNSSNARGVEDVGMDESELGIPGAFPDLKVSRNGNEEMVLFPSYAKRHTKKSKPPRNDPTSLNLKETTGPGDLDYWRKEWETYEDTNAVVDVDVRGWIYSPHTGPMTRKNRLMLGIARHLSGIPAPSAGSEATVTTYRERVYGGEDDLAAKEAREISRRGEQEADVAGRGGYSEGPEDTASSHSRPSSPRPGDFPHPVTNTSLGYPPDPGGLSQRSSWSQPSNMSSEELAVANSHLLRRLKPFFTNPSINLPITIFYYNDDTSQSRTTSTNESGHFNFRASLNFVPTHVRVLASENLSAATDIKITEPHGISLISDIDDTIKHSAIGGGAKEIFRNAFIRELGDLTIEGVREWYNKMSNMDVKLHYLSNSPWQMYPLLVSYFAKAGLPPGSFHLKQYSGMLQGIFEPVAERKKGTLERIMNDFPDRRFILVGDSGEADLELYTETALAHQGRILGIFIRDVSTSRSKGFFDPSGASSNCPKSSRPVPESSARPTLPPRPMTTTSPITAEPEMEDLIDFSDDDGGTQTQLFESTPRSHASSGSSLKKPPPPPSKPVALRSKSSESSQAIPKPIEEEQLQRNLSKPHDLASTRKELLPAGASFKPGQSKPIVGTRNEDSVRRGYRSAVKSKVASAYNALPSATSYWNGTPQDVDAGSLSHSPSNRVGATDTKPGAGAGSTSRQAPPVPPRRSLSSYPAAAAQYASNRIWNGASGDGSANGSASLGDKREELWKRRLARAQELLEGRGVLLKIWRKGDDVAKDAMLLVERSQQVKK